MARALCVYVVDHDRAVRELYQEELLKRGFLAVCFDRCEQLLEALAIALPDMVIADWFMPGMSGLELAGEMRRNETLSKLPVILTSSVDLQMDDAMAARTCRVNAYLRKPFDFDVLEKLIYEELSKNVFCEAEQAAPEADAVRAVKPS